MKRLKCPDCGGQVVMRTTPEGHILGTCVHCAADFVIEAKGRQHIILEHRFPDGAARPAKPEGSKGALGRRAVLGFGGVAVAGALVMGLNRGSKPAADRRPQAEVLFNVGGEGPAAGQFRDQVFAIGIDSLGRAALVDNRDRVYIYGPEGQFISQYPLQGGRFCAVLPAGEMIVADSNRLIRLSLTDGTVLETVTTQSDPRGWNAAYAVTAQGGLAVYTTEDHGHGNDTGKAVKDQITLYGPDLRQQRQVQGLLAQAIAPDPMVEDWPEVTDIAVDPAGSFYLNIRAAEDHDLRGGIFEFNAAGRLQRRIEVAQDWHGHLAIGTDNALWYGDAWRGDLQRISPAGRQVLPLSGLGTTPDTALGNVAAFAVYPDGDLGVTTMNHRFVRLRPRLDEGLG